MELDQRKLQILRAIVDEYIQTAEPVGSKALQQKYRLPYSSATIRNDMMALEDSDWNAAKGYFDRILDADAKSGDAYLGLFMVGNRVGTFDSLEKMIMAMDTDPAAENRPAESGERQDILADRVH